VFTAAVFSNANVSVVLVDIKYPKTWLSFVHVAFVTNVFVQRVFDWWVATTLCTEQVLDAWSRHCDHACDSDSLYLSIRNTERLDEAHIATSGGTVSVITGVIQKNLLGHTECNVL